MTTNDPNDEKLVIRCQLGETDAWESLIDHWHPKLWRFLSNMLSDQSVAEDVLQIVWLRVVRSLGSLRRPDRFGPWIYRIARLAVADRLRDSYRQPITTPLDDVCDQQDRSDLVEMMDAVSIGLSGLHPADREAVILHYFDQLPIDEVASICSAPVGTIKSRLHRARRLIRNRLDNEGTSQ